MHLDDFSLISPLGKIEKRPFDWLVPLMRLIQAIGNRIYSNTSRKAKQIGDIRAAIALTMTATTAKNETCRDPLKPRISSLK